jgi:hypothetical protein
MSWPSPLQKGADGFSIFGVNVFGVVIFEGELAFVLHWTVDQLVYTKGTIESSFDHES